MSASESPKSETTGSDFPPQYDPKSFEDRIYASWEGAGVFHSEPNPGAKPYTVMIPPPNVTGVLHIGHALNNTLQDILVRWRRMQGMETLWLPGTDHAGIATQNVVEKQISKAEKKNRYQIGRAELIKRIWAWKEQSGGTILKQLRKLGASCDWQRTRFTMDAGLSKAVRQAFVKLHNDGLIYRGKYLVNWCPRCRTTLSDDEVEHADVKAKIYEIHYPLSEVARASLPAGMMQASFPAGTEAGATPEGGHGGPPHLTVATTRPETMLGDTAVAVHPDDERYKDYVGRFVDLPLTGRKIPVIADSALERGFGTGCLKVTPAHDPVDYQIGLRHKLPVINIFTESALLNNHVPEPYRGLDRVKAREKVLEDLKAQGLLGEVKDYSHSVGHCYRCHTAIEPYLTAQWFVKMKPLSELAKKATAEGRVSFHPERWTKVYLKWFDDVRDWPISRQIWWGHQIPVWYDLDENKGRITMIDAGPNEPYDIEKDGKRYRYLIGEDATPIVTLEDPETLPQYQGKQLLRDPDVLDTWFSSALWPFSTLGWPEQTKDVQYYYPTSTLVTARGIIYFWVARMVMMGETMLGREPFRDVYIHGTVLDEQGRIMSKSLGNGIDPLDVIAQYGADALRFTLATMCTEGQDLKVSMKRFEMGRNFSNKVWNAARYVLTTMPVGPASLPAGTEAGPTLRDEDRWILSRLNSTVRDVTAALDNFEFARASNTLYDFFWNEFCSWYIELSKPRLLAVPSPLEGEGRASDSEAGVRGLDQAAAKAVLLYTLDRSLRLLHPFCPFVSEALWHELNQRSAGSERNLGKPEYKSPAARQNGGQFLATARWPQAEVERIDPELEQQFASTFEAVIAIRAVRQELIDNSPKERKKDVSAALARPLKVTIRTADKALAGRLCSQSHILMQMAEIEEPQIQLAGAEAGATIPPPQPAAATAIKGGTIYVELSADLVEVEKLRLAKEIAKAEQHISKIAAKLKNESFVKNAPPELVDEERKKLEEVQNRLGSLKAALAELK
ncbi:MAG TPA: valine--tRNA ligase [Planctomycetota bacterium]|jgi:valyl-tRNA synthetase